MRQREDVETVLELKAQGLGASAIARRSGIPRSTVREWLVRPPSRSEARSRIPRPSPRSYAYLLGVYLGDGNISEHARSVFRLRLHLDLRYPAILDECEAAVREVMPNNRVNRLPRRSNYTPRDRFTHIEMSCYSKKWVTLFPQHGPGRKHERPIELRDWQMAMVQSHAEPFLRGLIHSDGCRSINTGTNWRFPRYSFRNRSDDILGLFEWGCELVGVHYTQAPYTVYVSRKADVARMDEFIGPKR